VIEWLDLAMVLLAPSQQPAAGALCRPVVKESSAPGRTATASYYDQGRDSIVALHPRHRLLAERRSGQIGRVEYSLLAYQPQPSSSPVTISALAVDWEARRSWWIESACSAAAWPTGLIDFLATLGGLPGQTLTTTEGALIEAVRSTVAREIDPQLPSVSFEGWLTSVIGSQARVWWEVNDCGEQTGNPALDRGRNFPRCVQARAELTGNRALFVVLSTGPQQQQPGGVPGLHFAVLIPMAGRQVEIRRLTDLASAIR
jgi:hypothetical protein